MGNLNFTLVGIFCCVLLAFGSVEGQYSEDFDGLVAGDLIGGTDGWETWDEVDDDGLDAAISDAEAFDGDNSLAISTTTDIVRPFVDEFTSGRWTVLTRVLVPDTSSGAGYFILLNTYAAPATGAKNWSTQIIFDTALGEIRNAGGSGFALPGTVDLVTDEWLEIKVHVDLDENTQEVYIDDELLSDGIWESTGALEIACMDLYGDTADPEIYFDSISIIPDCDFNGVDDATDIEDDPTLDCDDNGVLDSCDLDCDDNGVADVCDIDDDPDLDCDGDGLLDQCQTYVGDAEQLFASDAGDGDGLGTTVARSGPLVLVGSPFDDDDGTDAGSAYVYRLDGGVWVEEQRLVGGDTAASDRFASAIAIDGTTAVVGVYRDDDDGGNSGSIYVFDYDSGLDEWVETEKLTAGDAASGDQFGWAVSISADWIAVGARATDGAGSNSGSVYLFERDSDGSWNEEQELEASDAGASDQFGRSLALDGDTLLIGASADDDGGSNAGAVYVFTLDTEWSETEKLTASDADVNDQFGTSVALRGEVAIIGAPLEGDLPDDAGAAYVFRDDGTSWTEEAKLTASDAELDADFGFAVAIAGGTALVGAPSDDAGNGSAYLFNFDGSDWAEGSKLLAIDPEVDDVFGISVDLGGVVVAVGASGDGDGTVAGGAFYVSVNGDCNENGVPDSCEIDDGFVDDVNDNGIPDSCEDDTPPPSTDEIEFKRGDADGNGSFSALLDSLFLLLFAFMDGDAPLCDDAADVDGNGTFSALLDSLFALQFAFQMGDAPPDPGAFDCGPDPEVNSLECEETSDECL